MTELESARVYSCLYLQDVKSLGHINYLIESIYIWGLLEFHILKKKTSLMQLIQFILVRTTASRRPYDGEYNQAKETVLQCFYG